MGIKRIHGRPGPVDCLLVKRTTIRRAINSIGAGDAGDGLRVLRDLLGPVGSPDGVSVSGVFRTVDGGLVRTGVQVAG